MVPIDLPPLLPPPRGGPLHLADAAVWQDLQTFVGRARRVDGGGAIHLSAPEARPVLATWIAVLDGVAGTVLGMRTFALTSPGNIEVTVYLSGVADRLARHTNVLYHELSIPPVRATASWAEHLPPASSWEPVGRVPVDQVQQVARSGAEELAAAAPEAVGRPVVEALRSRIWFAAMLEGVPAGAAFALDVLGFLPATGEVDVYRVGDWYRLSTAKGHVVSKIVAKT